MNSLDERIKSALENYEAEYNPADWDDMKKRLEKHHGFKISSRTILSLLFPVIIGTIAGFIYIFSTDNKYKTIVSKTTIQSETDGKASISHELQIHEKKDISANSGAAEEMKSLLSAKEVALIDKKPDSKENVTTLSKPNINTFVKENPPAENTGNENLRKSANPGFPAPRASFYSDRNTVCANNQIKFFLENTDVPCEYRWDFGDGEFSGDMNPVHSFRTPGIYTVKLEVISLIDKKTDVQIMKDFITVNPVPVADFNWKNNDDLSEIGFESAQDDILEWNWNFGDKHTSVDQKPNHIFAKKGNYTVALSLKNNYGCVGNCQKNVIIPNDFNLLAPNAFSPNGDGKNDTWLPVALLSGDYIFSLTILDKNGQVAYKTNSANNPWDGRHLKTNEVVKTGDAFKWIAVAKDKNGIESTHGGVISITESSGNY